MELILFSEEGIIIISLIRFSSGWILKMSNTRERSTNLIRKLVIDYLKYFLDLNIISSNSKEWRSLKTCMLKTWERKSVKYFSDVKLNQSLFRIHRLIIHEQRWCCPTRYFTRNNSAKKTGKSLWNEIHSYWRLLSCIGKRKGKETDANMISITCWCCN